MDQKPKTLQTRALFLGAAIACGTGLPNAFGEGFRNPPAGASGLARSGGRFAHASGPSAITHNPANLATLDTASAEASFTLVHFSAEYLSPNGSTTETIHPWKLLPNLYWAAPLPAHNITIGLGLTTPYGISNEWEQKGPFNDPASLRYSAPYFAELKTINANPTIAFKLNDTLRLGAGLNVSWSELRLKQFYPWFMLPGGIGNDPEGLAAIKGDGVGVGANLALSWDISRNLRAAITYRSPIDVDLDGSLAFSAVPDRALLFGATPQSPFNSALRLPTQVGAGLGVQVNENVQIEISAEWIEFSRFGELNLGVANNAFLLPATTIQQNWNDTFTAGIGGQWNFSKQWTALASYHYYQSPVPDETFGLTIPDAHQNALTAGLRFTTGKHSLEMAYGGILYDQRTINNGPAYPFNGTYNVSVHLASFSYRLAF